MNLECAAVVISLVRLRFSEMQTPPLQHTILYTECPQNMLGASECYNFVIMLHDTSYRVTGILEKKN